MPHALGSFHLFLANADNKNWISNITWANLHTAEICHSSRFSNKEKWDALKPFGSIRFTRFSQRDSLNPRTLDCCRSAVGRRTVTFCGGQLLNISPATWYTKPLSSWYKRKCIPSIRHACNELPLIWCVFKCSFTLFIQFSRGEIRTRVLRDIQGLSINDVATLRESCLYMTQCYATLYKLPHWITNAIKCLCNCTTWNEYIMRPMLVYKHQRRFCETSWAWNVFVPCACQPVNLENANRLTFRCQYFRPLGISTHNYWNIQYWTMKIWFKFRSKTRQSTIVCW